MHIFERDGQRYIDGTGTYVDGSEYYGPAEFEDEHGCTFDEFCEQQEATEVTPEKEGKLYRED